MPSPKSSKKRPTSRAAQMRWLLREMIRGDSELKPRPPKGKRTAKKRSPNTRRPVRVL